MQQLLQEERRTSHSISSAAPSWIGSFALALAAGIAYFLAAQLSLVLLTKPDGVAVFWPAAGIASGIVIALGSAARLPVTVGVVVATVTANLLGDRNLLAGLVFALCNAGESLLIGWLIERNSGARFSLDSIQRVLSFLLAVVIGVAASGIGGTVGFALFHSSNTTMLMTWFNWFVSDALGVIAVAPLFIGLGDLRVDPPKRWELAEGTLVLAVLAAATVAAFTPSTHAWHTLLPLGLLLPILLAARCRPVFVAAAALILGFAVVWTTTFGIGEWGDPTDHFADRVHGARATLLAISICTLVLAALFTERRLHETVLKHHTDRLQLALDGAELGVWSVDAKTGRLETDDRDRLIHGYSSEAPPRTVKSARPFIHPDDLPALDSAFEDSKRAGGRCNVEYRLAPAFANRELRQPRWVAVAGTVVRDPTGQPVRWLGVTRDITERKHAEESLCNSEQKLRGLLGALPAAVYVTDADGRISYCNQGAVDLWGAEPRLGEDRWNDLCHFLHSDGTPMALADCPTRIALTRGYAVRDVEAILERLDGTRTSIMTYPTPIYDPAGVLTGIINMMVDISERKNAERKLDERNTQLSLAGRVALVGCFNLDLASGDVQVSEGYSAIHGLPGETKVAKRDDWRARVHPDDLPRLDANLQRVIADHKREHFCEYRIISPSGELRHIESRSIISYDHDGVALRIIGANIDVTASKRAEAGLRESEGRLAAALDAGQVIAFEWDAVACLSRHSENAARILGYDADGAGAWRQSKFLECIHPDDREPFKRHISELCPAKPSYSLSFRFCVPDRGQIWLEETARGEFDAAGELLRVKGLTRNVTERKKAEEELAERTLQLSLAGRSAGVGTYAYDFNTEVSQISEGYAELYGLSERTAEFGHSEWLAKVLPEDLAEIEDRRNQAFQERRSEYAMEYRIVRSGQVRWVESRSFISYDSDGRPQRVIGVNIDITERKLADAHQRTLIAELDHRVKNVLATISAVAAHTLDTSSSMDHFVAALDGRIRSMGSTHELLSESRWQGVSLAALLRRELTPYSTRSNTVIKGPTVLLSPTASQTLASVIHELTTNAAKYGALSTRDGRVSVGWHIPRNENGSHRLIVEWQETGGPAVKTPSKHGYGTKLIADLIPYELGGTLDLAFSRDGVRCRMEIPGQWVGTGHRRAMNAESASAVQIYAQPLSGLQKRAAEDHR